MAHETNFAQAPAIPSPRFLGTIRLGISLGLGVVLAFLFATLFFPKGFALAVFGNTVQVGLLAAATLLACQSFLRSHSRLRIFWFLIFAGSLLWTAGDGIWAVYDLWFARPVPQLAVIDTLLFLKVVPLTAAIAIAPDRRENEEFSAFGLLDIFVLMVYALYLFAFCVFAYRLLPGGEGIYNFNFNVANAIGNQALVTAAGIAVLRAKDSWRGLYRLYFFFAACYGVASVLRNVANDLGHYYTGNLYDLPLVASLAAFFGLTLAGCGATLEQRHLPAAKRSGAPSGSATLASHLALLAALSVPVIGVWLLSSASAPPQLRAFRLTVTPITIFLLILLLSIKQDILAAGLFQSLQRLSATYSSIERLKTHLTQSEKLTALGELVAQVANQIKSCMASILEASSRLTSRPDGDSRIQNMAGKIGQYAQRTDMLVDNMLHFAQETPLCLVPLDVKPVLENALHLSRVAKLPEVQLEFTQEGNVQLVRGDSGQLLHVFLQLISNAVDALEEAGGGTFKVTLRLTGSRLLVEFADSGPGLKEPQRVFEPFYTTKPVGKGTGLGLNTCYGIIQQHEGEISCRNRPEGGAAFTVLLPVIPESLPEESQEAGRLLAKGVQ